ncbi:MAG TPA: nitroreductase family protein [Puia sp.]|uniref:nitroreductase family protein n=1 Tax=Puia sp. TaxID=2045100 RepID=UPI002C0D5B35|nr:nitroreductase family protein [Puia sp.]HVU94154.1 nitroreductase family protein [Puia sp.]
MRDLLTLIKQRQSSRCAFDPDRPVPKKALEDILEAACWAPTAHNMQNFEIVVVDDKKLLEKIREIHFPVSETFIQENYLQLSFSEEELKRKKTGVLSTMFPKSWLHPGLIAEHSSLNETDQPFLERHHQLLSCPLMVFLLYDPKRRAPGSDGDFLGVMSLGCVLENMWLMAASLAIGFHVVSALSGSSPEAELKRILHIPNHLSLAIAFRLGYPLASTSYLRVRRDIDNVTHHNGF